MTAEYPKEAQNPPDEPGMRPGDQPAPKVRVPGDKPDVEKMTTDERMREDPERQDHMPPTDNGAVDEDVVTRIGKE